MDESSTFLSSKPRKAETQGERKLFFSRILHFFCRIAGLGIQKERKKTPKLPSVNIGRESKADIQEVASGHEIHERRGGGRKPNRFSPPAPLYSPTGFS